MGRAISVVCALFCWFSSLASAQTSVVLLPARGDDRLPAQRDAAQQALFEALSQQGFTVVAHADALSRLPEGSTACSAVDCAPSMLRTLSLNVAAACAVWLSPDAPEGTVFVTLVDDAGSRYPGAHPVHAGNLVVATRAALAEARGLHMLGPGPWVRIHGVPEHAKVFIDGQLVGALPYRAAMTAGRYDLRVEAPEHISEEQDLDIPLNAGRVVEVEVALVPGQEPARAGNGAQRDTDGPASRPVVSPGPHTHSERHAQAGDYLLGAALAVPGLLLMTINPIQALAKGGDCADATCRNVYTFGARTTAELVGGAALVAAGAVVAFGWKPFALQVSTGTETSVRLTTRF